MICNGSKRTISTNGELRLNFTYFSSTSSKMRGNYVKILKLELLDVVSV